MLTVEELRQYRYFSHLSDYSIEMLSEKLGTVTRPAGTKIITQGSPADSFYFVKSGEVEITKRNRFGQTAKLTVLSSGEAFGEVALLTCSHRTTSVWAKSDVTLYSLGKKDFEEIVIGDSTFKHMLRRKTGDYAAYNKIKASQPFALLDPERWITFVDKMQEKRYLPGEHIVSEGEKGDYFYIIKTGSVEVLKQKEGGETEKVAVLAEGESFGEEALIREEGRRASVRAVEHTKVLAMAKKDFDAILKASFLEYSFPEDLPEDERGRFVFIDTRIPPEYEEEHIEGAVNIPLEELREKYRELDPDQEYLTYCTNDSRGMASAFLLSAQGFKAKNLRGGLSAWTGPTTTGSEGVHFPSVD